MVAGREAGHVAGVADDERGDDRSDPVQREQRRVRRSHDDFDPSLDRSDVTVETADVADQVNRLLFALRDDAVDRANGSQEGDSTGGGESPG
ncbi:MAG: hypothetical protein NVS3B21_20870 [Acidimicrobiales bacterium]